MNKLSSDTVRPPVSILFTAWTLAIQNDLRAVKPVDMEDPLIEVFRERDSTVTLQLELDVRLRGGLQARVNGMLYVTDTDALELTVAELRLAYNFTVLYRELWTKAQGISDNLVLRQLLTDTSLVPRVDKLDVEDVPVETKVPKHLYIVGPAHTAKARIARGLVSEYTIDGKDATVLWVEEYRSLPPSERLGPLPHTVIVIAHNLEELAGMPEGPLIETTRHVSEALAR